MPTDDVTADAFTVWYHRAYPRVIAAILTQISDRDLARDATDEAFARALERWHRVGAMAAPELWTYRDGLNVARRAGRRSTRERTLWRRATDEQPGRARSEPDRADPVLWAAVAALPDRQRQAVVLRYLLDLSQTRIATEMGIAPGTVAATLSQARHALAAALGAEGGDALAPAPDRGRPRAGRARDGEVAP